jgi:hypothetical protein
MNSFIIGDNRDPIQCLWPEQAKRFQHFLCDGALACFFTRLTTVRFRSLGVKGCCESQVRLNVAGV